MELQKGMRGSVKQYFDIYKPIDICITTVNRNISFFCYAIDRFGQSIDNYNIQEKDPSKQTNGISFSQVNRVKRYSLLLNRIPNNISKLTFVISFEELFGEHSPCPVFGVRQNNSTILSLQLDRYITEIKSMMVLFEIYFKEEWRFATVLQEYYGGLSGFLQSIGINGFNNTCDEPISKPKLAENKSIYTKWAGKSVISKPRINLDKYGNAAGAEYDLVSDHTFDNEIIYVLNLCSQYCTLDKAEKALSRKGFTVLEDKQLPDCDRFSNLLREASQFWLISGCYLSLTGTHINLIKEFFDKGHGIYIWGDNNPWYADANSVINNIFHLKMFGDSPGDQVVTLSGTNNKKSGIIPNHLISTGVENIFEGHTVAEVETDEFVRPLMYGSNEKVITAFYDKDGKRALIDGGFTRLYEEWDSAGTDRYVVNAAAWLVNAERFRDKIKINKNIMQ